MSAYSRGMYLDPDAVRRAPRCDICRRPMLCGQQRRHFSCIEGALKRFDAPASKSQANREKLGTDG
ncbi:Uncharacterised protein [Mycobacteroides abscessus subsp. massiliense]|uniref:Uncharacterized protein n=1 Tax=Mycobacteroides abscessus subsp. massiliense TaxID=1962118 RepID=A0A1T8VGV1_9MYCO|nr:Uncharacterised protein [Mycobacteroides abscessus subsp. massiliense]